MSNTVTISFDPFDSKECERAVGEIAAAIRVVYGELPLPRLF